MEIDAGHRLVDHEGKCRNLHGHRYSFRIRFTANDLDKIGRVIDFSEIKNKVGGWLESNWDHGMILNEKDPLSAWFSNEEVYVKEIGPKFSSGECYVKSPLYGNKYFILPANPSAENLSSYLYKIANELMTGTNVKVTKVTCRETPNCAAMAQL